jgi:hypothetical protein
MKPDPILNFPHVYIAEPPAGPPNHSTPVINAAIHHTTRLLEVYPKPWEGHTGLSNQTALLWLLDLCCSVRRVLSFVIIGIKHLITLSAEAWHVITTTDPIIDSDEEIGDEQARQDYSTLLDFLFVYGTYYRLVQRLHIINMVRRKEPTPEPERTQIRG